MNIKQRNTNEAVAPRGVPLRAVRTAHGMSLREVSRRSGVDSGHLSRIERGEVGLSVDVLARLAPVLGLKDLASRLKPFVSGGNGHAA